MALLFWNISLSAAGNAKPLTNEDGITVEIGVDGTKELGAQAERFCNVKTSISFLCTIHWITSWERLYRPTDCMNAHFINHKQLIYKLHARALSSYKIIKKKINL